jgi:branched-chain amino acid transport system substrate-binding protein
VLKAKGHKNAVFITWKYAAGDEMMEGFKEGFENQGGKLVKELSACPSRTSSSRPC